MFARYMEDYYRSKLGVKEICELAGFSKSTFDRWLKRNDLKPRQSYFAMIDTGNKELDQVLKDRYSSIVNRCNGKTTDYYGKYNGLPYMAIYEWVDFCHENKEKLLNMWDDFDSNRQFGSRYSISVDRVDESKGYTKDNIQFVTHGFNSWKRSITPIEVTHEGKIDYFLTKKDASLHYGLREQAIGEVYNQSPYHIKGYEVRGSTIQEVLSKRKFASVEEYYERTMHIRE